MKENYKVKMVIDTLAINTDTQLAIGYKIRPFTKEDSNQKAIGTVNAWYGNLRNKDEGRIHWLGSIPKYQGKNLAKPLMLPALKILKSHHEVINSPPKQKVLKQLSCI